MYLVKVVICLIH